MKRGNVWFKANSQMKGKEDNGMKNRITWLIVTYLVVSSLVLASCAPAAPAAPTAPTAPTAPAAPTAPTAPATPVVPTTEVPKYGGVLSIMDTKASNFGPVFDSKTSLWALSFTNEPLYQGDWTKGAAGTNEYDWFIGTGGTLNSLGPWLATSYEIPDNETIILRIRQGVHYALDSSREASRLVGGREMTAEDVAFSINAWISEPGAYLQTRVPAESHPILVTATDKYTVVYKLRPGTKSIVFHQDVQGLHIFPPEVYTKYDKMRDWKNSVGTGPFLIKDHVPNASTTYVRNPNYWLKDPIGPGEGQQLPYIDGVRVFIIPDSSTRQAALRTAKVDVASGEVGRGSGLSWEDTKSMLKTAPQLQYAKFISTGPTGIGLRVDKPELPWYNKSVRHALTMAIDYDTIIRDYFGGDAQLAYPITPRPEFMLLYTPLEQRPQSIKDIYTYNPDKAKRLLAEAGYPNGFKVKVLTQQSFVDELSIIKEYWSKIGVDMELDVRENTVFVSITRGFQHEQAVGGRLTAATPYAFHDFQPADISNSARVNDPYVNELFAKLQEDYYFIDETFFAPEMKKFFLYALEQAWYIQFPATYDTGMWWPWVKNYHGQDYLGGGGRHGWTRFVWIDQALKKSMGF